MLITHATVFLEGRFVPDISVRLNGGKIRQIGSSLNPEADEEIFDAKNHYLLPGFVDVHTHAYGGHDVMRGEEDIRSMSRAYGKLGVSAFLPTTMSASPEETRSVLKDIGKVMDRPEPEGATVAGAHMEAPFLSSRKAGAQQQQFFLSPDLQTFMSLCDNRPETVRMITLAPELPGADELISGLTRMGIVVSAGHTNADAATVHHAADLGLSHATHLFNAHPALHHRAPGSVGAALTDPRIRCELICDGEHLHPDIIRLAIAAKGAEGVLVITDSMEAAGMPEGTYALGGQPVYVHGDRATLENGTLAGSILTMPRALQNLLRWNIPPETAIPMCTSTPAVSAGLEGFGHIREGWNSTLTLWDRDWNMLRVFH